MVNTVVRSTLSVFLLVAAADSAAQTCSQDPYEPDDACPSATAIVGGQTQGHDFCDDPGDWVEFDTCPGRNYTIETANLGPAADTILELFAPDCTTVLAADDNGGGGFASRIDWTATGPGTHRARAR